MILQFKFRFRKAFGKFHYSLSLILVYIGRVSMFGEMDDWEFSNKILKLRAILDKEAELPSETSSSKYPESI